MQLGFPWTELVAYLSCKHVLVPDDIIILQKVDYHTGTNIRSPPDSTGMKMTMAYPFPLLIREGGGAKVECTFAGICFFQSSWLVWHIVESRGTLLAVGGCCVVLAHTAGVHLPPGHSLPWPGDARVCMSIAHAAPSHDPFPHTVVLEAAVGEEGDLWEQV